jgi:hypothetical protein
LSDLKFAGFEKVSQCIGQRRLSYEASKQLTVRLNLAPERAPSIPELSVMERRRNNRYEYGESI